MIEGVKKTPTPIAGLMLALAAAGNLMASYGMGIRNLFGMVSFIIFVFIVAKNFMNPDSLKEDLKNPVVASVVPTFFMGGMVLSTYAKPYIGGGAFVVWGVFVMLHLFMMVFYTKRFLMDFKIKKIFPSIFVVYVGIVVASVTAPAYGMQGLGKALFWFGLISYLVLLPIAGYRAIKVKGIPEPALPTLVIFAAPASLCLAGYMSSFPEKSVSMVIFLTTLSLIMYLIVLALLPKLLKVKFYPSYSAFTFPLVISAIAMKMTNGYLKAVWKSNALEGIVKFQEAISVTAVLYVLFCFVQFLFVKRRAVTEKA
ncbi:C4-dicarboxylate ABC transporter [Propionigenium maris DSM 9537]|uniref:C4-dicarboxylate ABC transporter n=1 Tax=Propionigenium maris DSM 9537 TaxID=1123000 RepID=A0A9W6GPR2_9FUSO|nr:TDT family transporter [Propionigenium maris]GLI57806.1 C4-dicarboxylate ABC transporter [Propionigenium maris DSM 9537]